MVRAGTRTSMGTKKSRYLGRDEGSNHASGTAGNLGRKRREGRAKKKDSSRASLGHQSDSGGGTRGLLIHRDGYHHRTAGLETKFKMCNIRLANAGRVERGEEGAPPMAYEQSELKKERSKGSESVGEYRVLRSPWRGRGWQCALRRPGKMKSIGLRKLRSGSKTGNQTSIM